MSNSVNESLRENIQDLIDAGIKTSFTMKDLKRLGVKLREPEYTPLKIKYIRKQTHQSQATFAYMLGVSSSAVQKWELGERKPPGSVKVLLKMLDKNPHSLDWRLSD